MSPGLPAVANGLLLIHYLTHAILIVGGVGWLGTAVSAGWILPASNPLFLGLIAISSCWQMARLISFEPLRRDQTAATQ